MHPRIGAEVSFMWNLTAGHAKDKWAIARLGYNAPIDQYTEYARNWLWGSQACIAISWIGGSLLISFYPYQTSDYISIANKTIDVLGKLHVDTRPTEEQVKEITGHSRALFEAAFKNGSYLGFPFRVRFSPSHHLFQRISYSHLTVRGCLPKLRPHYRMFFDAYLGVIP